MNSFLKKTKLIVAVFLHLSATAQDEIKTGLQFLPEEQKLGIPLASTPFSGDELPRSVDLSGRMPPAGSQGNQNSCVAWAVVYAYKSYQEKIEENNGYTNGGGLNYNAVFSPAYVYNQINNGRDGGSFFPDALNILSQQGAVKWTDMPYNDRDFMTKPNETQRSKAKRYRIDYWRRVNVMDAKELKAQLNAGYPVMIGALVDKGFYDGGFAAGGQDFYWRSQIGKTLGGHAMLVVGYDDGRNAFKVLNSWGQQWGRSGYCWITYDYFPRVVREAYVMKDAVNSGPNPNPQQNPSNPQPSNPYPAPNPNPTQELQTQFFINNVQHNIPSQTGNLMRFDGSLAIPANLGRSMQVVIRFYYNNGQGGKGQPVYAAYPNFAMPDGTVACGAPRTNINGAVQTTWYATLPYTAFNVQRGSWQFGQYRPFTTYLIAEPTLYIDNFAVKTGGLIPFFVAF